jgi:hypothetical protein
MYKAISTAGDWHPNNTLNSFTENTSFKYSKKVIDEEQFIPMYSCLPYSSRALPQYIGVRPGMFINLNNVVRAVETYPPWISDRAVAAFSNAETITPDVYSMIRRIGGILEPNTIVEVLATLILSQGYLKVVRQNCIKQIDQLIDLWSDVTKPHPNALIEAVANLVYSLIPVNGRINTTPKLVNWHYTFPITSDALSRISIAHWLDATIDGNHISSGYEQGSGMILSRYGYAGYVEPMEAEAPPDPVILSAYAPRPFTPIPPCNGYNGLTSLFCVMVKAKYRPDILVKSAAGTLHDLVMARCRTKTLSY